MPAMNEEISRLWDKARETELGRDPEHMRRAYEARVDLDP